MERVHSSPLVQKVSPFLEQIKQRRQQAKQEKAQAELDLAKQKEQEWRDFLLTCASPLEDGSKEQEFAIQLCHEQMLKRCDSVSGFFFELPNLDFRDRFPKWPLIDIFTLAHIGEASKKLRFRTECLTNLKIALERDGLTCDVKSDSLWITWPREI